MTRTCVRFLLGHEPRELTAVDPTRTVLDWLRIDERRTGTKEGCNEGDCGACTVVVARPEAGRLRYRAVNACIQFVAALDGGQLLTVEDLREPGGALHPVQRAMVETHASQCGFCTPGFVMALWALTRSTVALDDGAIDDALAGNLCRCTGYAPIARAVPRMVALGAADDAIAARGAETLARLKAWADESTVIVGEGGRRFIAPATADALAGTLLAEPEAVIVAGATDVGLWVTKQLRRPATIVHLGRVAALRQVADLGDAVEVGAMVTHADAVAALACHYPDLGELWRRFAGMQTRNVGTVGGSIANGSPIGDLAPALIAAGAGLRLRRGPERRTLPLEDFFLGYGRQDRRPGEFVEAVVVPKPATATRYRAYKVSKRFDSDISAVLGAFALRVEGGVVAEARLAYGGMAATPKRAAAAEAALCGQPLAEPAVRAAMAALADDFAPISDARASAGYRMKVARNLLLRFHLETSAGPTVPTRLVGASELARV